MKFLLFLGVLTISFLAMGTASAYAVTFTVDVDINGTDDIPGDGVCATSGSDCTLHAAIEEANALAGPDTIEFNIPGGGVRTITPIVDLPDITQPTTIDGSTQPGATCGSLVPASKQGSNTPHSLLIEIDGSLTASSVIRFDNQSENSTIRGLVINGGLSKIDIISGNTLNDTLIECNYLGTEPDGMTAPANNGYGILTNGAFEQSTIRNNLISGNTNGGIFIDRDENTIEGNLIGTTADGNVALGNSLGIFVNYYTNDITNNIISGNTSSGIFITNGGYNNIFGNVIGLGLNGATLGNDTQGVYVYNSWNNIIGGTSEAETNTISGNLSDGILLSSDCNNGTFDNQVIGNNIGSNIEGQYVDGLGNSGAGVRISGFDGTCSAAFRNRIGGAEAGEANVIVGNGEQGVVLHQEQNTSVFGTTIIGNSIYSNGGLSIDLASDDVPDSDGFASADIGLNPINSFLMEFPAERANSFINYPTINSATHTDGLVAVNYNFAANSVQNSPPELQTSDLVGYRLDFYMNDTKDILGSGYGKTHMGSFIVDGSESRASHEFTSPIELTAASEINISATATVLWRNKGTTPDCDTLAIYGEAPPYQIPSCGG